MSGWPREGDQGEVVVAVAGNHQVVGHRSRGEREKREAEDGRDG